MAGVGHQHDVARRGDGLREVGQSLLRAERDDDLALGDRKLDAEAPRVVRRLRLAQALGMPREAGVAMGARIAGRPRRSLATMCGAVSRSGLPMPRSITSRPAARPRAFMRVHFGEHGRAAGAPAGGIRNRPSGFSRRPEFSRQKSTKIFGATVGGDAAGGGGFEGGLGVGRGLGDDAVGGGTPSRPSWLATASARWREISSAGARGPGRPTSRRRPAARGRRCAPCARLFLCISATLCRMAKSLPVRPAEPAPNWITATCWLPRENVAGGGAAERCTAGASRRGHRRHPGGSQIGRRSCRRSGGRRWRRGAAVCRPAGEPCSAESA